MTLNSKLCSSVIQGKEIAVKVNKLEPGTVVFEDISTTRFRGHVLKAINTRLLNNSVDGHLTGMIEYQGKTDTHEVLFGDRDTEDDIQLQKGDVVEFNVSTGKFYLFFILLVSF